MAKKYLSLEEAAEFLGISVDEMKKARERGDVRGFADRANWKFRTEDLEEYGRTLSSDSNPDVPLMDSSVFDDVSEPGDGDSISEQATQIRQDSIFDDEGEDLIGPSDSDVRLVLDDDVDVSEPSGGSNVNLGDSDSDVRLIDDSGIDPGSDSDVRLLGDGAGSGKGLGDSDSDVRLVPDESAILGDSDSSVSLVPDDSEVKLVGDSSAALADEETILFADSGVDTEGPTGIHKSDDSSVFDDDVLGADSGMGSGILQTPADSGISLESDDSFDAEDVQLIDADSDITLETGDSGIALEGFADSGIALAGDDDDIFGADSGISMENPTDSGIALEALEDDGGSGNLDRTMPMMDAFGGDDLDETQSEMPVLMGDDDDDFELSGTDIEIPVSGNTGESTGVIVFDDDDDVDDFSPTMISKDDEDTFDVEDDFGADDEFDDFAAEDDLDVAPDIMGEDDELDVFDAADEDFDDAFASGTSHANFAAPAQQVVVAAPQAEWGVGTFIGVLLSTGVLALAGVVMYDLVRSMWAWEQPIAINSTLLEQLRGLF